MTRDTFQNAYLGSLVADAVSMPVHWYYDREALRAEYDEITGYLAPRNPHAGSILWRSHHAAPNEKGEILHDQEVYWRQRGIHYHQFLKAGENTLNFQLATELVRLCGKTATTMPTRGSPVTSISCSHPATTATPTWRSIIVDSSPAMLRASRPGNARFRTNTSAVFRKCPACYIAESMPASLYLAWKYHDNFDAGILANAMVGGDNCHRGAVVGSLLGAAYGVPAKWLENRMLSTGVAVD